MREFTSSTNGPLLMTVSIDEFPTVHKKNARTQTPSLRQLYL